MPPILAGAAAAGAVSSTIMGGDPGEGALYAMAAAVVSLGVQYANYKLQEYQAGKTYQAAHASTTDQASKVSPANQGYVRKVGLKNFTISKDARTEIGMQVQAGVSISPTPDPNSPFIFPIWLTLMSEHRG